MARKIPASLISAYNKAIKRQGSAAERSARAAMAEYMRENPDASLEDIREYAIEILASTGELYGNACSQAAFELQSEISFEFGAAQPDLSGWYYEPDGASVRKTAKYQVEKLKKGDTSGFVEQIGEAARFYAERGANETMAQSARRQSKGSGKRKRKGAAAYGVLYARVPQGITTCDFCIMLASRGFVYLTEESAGEANSFHKNCDCRIIPSVNGVGVEGYDPDAYYRQWQKNKEINARSDFSEQEKEILKLVAADSEFQFDLPRSRELAIQLDEVMESRKDSFKAELTQENYDKTIGAYIELLGRLYGMDIKGEFLLGEKVHSAMPDGYELWAATRMRGLCSEMQFLGTDRRRKKGNPDLLVDGVFIDIKTPESEKRIAKRINEGAAQCRNRGQAEGVVLLSPLRLDIGQNDIEGVAKKRIELGFADKVYLINSDLSVTELEKTSR